MNLVILASDRDALSLARALTKVRKPGETRTFLATTPMDAFNQLQTTVLDYGACHGILIHHSFTNPQACLNSEHAFDNLFLRKQLRDMYPSTPVICWGVVERGGVQGVDYHMGVNWKEADGAEALLPLLVRLRRGLVKAEYKRPLSRSTGFGPLGSAINHLGAHQPTGGGSTSDFSFMSVVMLPFMMGGSKNSPASSKNKEDIHIQHKILVEHNRHQRSSQTTRLQSSSIEAFSDHVNTVDIAAQHARNSNVQGTAEVGTSRSHKVKIPHIPFFASEGKRMRVLLQAMQGAREQQHQRDCIAEIVSEDQQARRQLQVQQQRQQRQIFLPTALNAIAAPINSVNDGWIDSRHSYAASSNGDIICEIVINKSSERSLPSNDHVIHGNIDAVDGSVNLQGDRRGSNESVHHHDPQGAHHSNSVVNNSNAMALSMNNLAVSHDIMTVSNTNRVFSQPHGGSIQAGSAGISRAPSLVSTPHEVPFLEISTPAPRSTAEILQAMLMEVASLSLLTKCEGGPLWRPPEARHSEADVHCNQQELSSGNVDHIGDMMGPSHVVESADTRLSDPINLIKHPCEELQVSVSESDLGPCTEQLIPDGSSSQTIPLLHTVKVEAPQQLTLDRSSLINSLQQEIEQLKKLAMEKMSRQLT